MNGNVRNTKPYRRGVRLGIYYKRIRDLLTKWDRCCVTAARARQIPSWLGHLPVYAGTTILSGLALWLLISTINMAVLMFMGVTLWLLRGMPVKKHAHAEDSNIEHSTKSIGPEYKNGEYGHGWYSSCGYKLNDDDN